MSIPTIRSSRQRNLEMGYRALGVTAKAFSGYVGVVNKIIDMFLPPPVTGKPK
jgi:hypothetical protein